MQNELAVLYSNNLINKKKSNCIFFCVSVGLLLL